MEHSMPGHTALEFQFLVLQHLPVNESLPTKFTHCHRRGTGEPAATPTAQPARANRAAAYAMNAARVGMALVTDAAQLGQIGHRPAAPRAEGSRALGGGLQRSVAIVRHALRLH
jgi:hypothetical protein